MLWFAAEVGVSKFVGVTGLGLPLRTDHSLPVTNAVARSVGTTVLDLTVEKSLPLSGSTLVVKPLVPELDDLFVDSVFRNRQTAAQSSTFDVGNRVLQAW